MKFIVYKDGKGEWRWSLKAANSKIIADCGEGYKEKRKCLGAIDKVKRGSATAPVEVVD